MLGLTVSQVIDLDQIRTQTALSEMVGVSQQAISQRLKKDAAIPVEWAIKIEAATGVSRHTLRPDIFGPPPQGGGRQEAA